MNNIVGLNVARLRDDRYLRATADLVNRNGGDWGYVTVVWTTDDRDGGAGELLLRRFVDRCFEYHLRPIVRVATHFDEGTGIWSRPEPDDAQRWRAYFQRASWPTSPVWVVAGNEPNLGRDWGGEVDAAGYAQYLAGFLYAFADSAQLKVVNAPLDASNTTELPVMQDAYEFLAEMDAAVPGIFERLPAWASNPYRVLGQGPDLRYTHLAYESELRAIGRDMPVLITEAGHLHTGDDHEIAAFYAEAFRDWMADPRVVAATPLFWHPDRGVFWMFDFGADGGLSYVSPTYELIQRLPRGSGSPLYAPDMENVARAAPADAERPGRSDRAAPTREVTAASAAVSPSDESTRGVKLRIVNTDGEGAHLRAEPSRTARSLRVIPEGAVVDALGPERAGEELRWRPIRTPDGKEGWIATSLLSPRDPASGG